MFIREIFHKKQTNIFDSIRKHFVIPNQIGHIISQGEIDFFLPKNCLTKFPLSYESVDGYIKIIKIKYAIGHTDSGGLWELHHFES